MREQQVARRSVGAETCGRELRRGLGVAIGACLLWSSGSFAQQAGGEANTRRDESAPLTEIVVTSTRIVRDGYDAPTPTTVIGLEEIQASAPSNIAHFLNKLPAVVGSTRPHVNQTSIGAALTGINTLNLRGLGGNRTLILLDGHRLTPATLTGLVDVNGLPQSLIERTDVVTAGASAAWGSDAVAGVVNFVLNKKFEGLKGDVQYGSTSKDDDHTYKVSLTGGTSFAGGRGHFLAAAEYAYNEGIRYNNRAWYRGAKLIFNPDYTATNGQPRMLVRQGVGYSNIAPGGMVVSGPLQGLYFGDNGVPMQVTYGSLVSSPYMIGGDWEYTDFGRNMSLLPEMQRYSIFTHASFDVTDKVQLYGQVSYGTAHSWGYSGPQYNFSGVAIRQDNAFLPPSVADEMAARSLASITVATWNKDRWDAEQHESESDRDQLRIRFGLNGQFDLFGSEWDWDVSLQRGINHVYNDIEAPIVARYNQAIDAVRGPNGAIVCRSTLTNPNDGCVPYNILGVGVGSREAMKWFTGVSWLEERFVQDVIDATVRGTPFSSWAGPVSVAFGAEYRKEKVSAKTDELSPTGAYFSGNYKPTFGDFDVKEAFLETVFPIASNAPMAKSFDLNAAVRATEYSGAGYVTTWKGGLTYTPVEDVTLRAVRSRDIRAPNMAEMFQAGSSLTVVVTDPFTNVTSNVRQVTMGNVSLGVEEADTLSVGLILRPRFVPGFSFAVDYYEIEIDEAIATPTRDQVLTQCYAGYTVYCPMIVRDGEGVITQINLMPANVAFQKARGVDFEMSYRLSLSDISPRFGDGSLSFRLFATHYLEMTTDNRITKPTNIVGSHVGNSAIPEWRYGGYISYNTGPLTFTVSGNGISSGVYDNSYIECQTNCPTSTAQNQTIDNNHIDGAFYVDTSVQYEFAPESAVYLSIDNVFDREPSVVATGTGISGPQPGTNRALYDIIGRTIRAGVRFSF
jgi:iron complex outermembrane receptor protein